ncbi:hypothetical protein M758_6G120400 [Ceratodon purpureus]|uniref:Uncharacterized protein n=1 Tax=Ceratodon purpureus TaxID=3225 RepID=A0A8T0HDT3_CERPU|nr:hypothetical protein KC19_6G125100 [Ceratodon purpureus]KAG0569921.1 hypothetical protein KC19_6G125100 [Ceratodon purpureus]KAG0613669.1 hypothetical protein M758_6G120400 [Ceratodon purpureus]KAG0613670.1 hypothetical protein M758_6G120400 [Ceratodon purpureus]
MAAMATVNAAAVMQTANLTSTPNARTLSSSAVQFGPMRLTKGNTITTARPARSSALVRAAGNPERIDKFFDGVKSDASQNAGNFGNLVSEKIGEVQDTVKDVGRDMAAKTQEAIDAAAGKVDEGGVKAQEVGDEVKTSTSDTLEAATDFSDGQNVLEKASNAAGNAIGNVQQNFDYGTGAVQNSAEDVKKDAKETADRL